MAYYKQLSMEERCYFHSLLGMGFGISEIARRLKRHRSSLYRELSRNQEKHGYSPREAQEKALKRCAKPCLVDRYPTLRSYITFWLKKSWSPEQIAGRLRRKNSKYSVCHETIYKYIYRKSNKKLYQYLRYRKPRRRRHFSRKLQACRYGEKRLITKRPLYIEKRVMLGHWEGDLVQFSDYRKKSITTLVERKTRRIILLKNEAKQSVQVMSKIIEKFIGASSKIFRTITFDQGGEFSRSDIIENNSHCRVYYCHVRSPWEKGSNENMNGRLRYYFPVSTDISKITQEELDIVAEKMNTTPRKCLGYRTPNEMFYSEFKKVCRTSS